MAAELLDQPEPPDSIAAVTRPSTLSVLLAPLVAIFQPTVAARTFVAARPFPFWTIYVLLCLAYAMVLACVPIVIEMLDAPGVSRDFFAARARLDRVHGLDVVEITFLVGLVVLPVLTALATWLMLTRTLRSEPLPAAVRRMFRAQASLAAFVLLLVVSILTLARITAYPWFRGFIGYYVESEALTVLIGMLLCHWLVGRVETAASAIEDQGVAPDRGPLCEGCGYDLTHTAVDGRCTECGRAVSDSLIPGRTRCSCDWENVPGRPVAAWLRSTGELLTGPRRFYETLAMHTDLHDARRFAAMHLRWIGVIAAIWVVSVTHVERAFDLLWSGGNPGQNAWHSLLAIAFVLAFALGTGFGRFTSWSRRSLLWFIPAVLISLVETPWLGRSDFPTNQVYWLAAMALCIAPLVCWLGHRVGGAIVSSIAIFFRFLPDYRRAEKVILYESVALWLYCTAWGVLATSFIIFGDWMTQSPLFRWIWDAFGIQQEPFAVLVVTVGISLLWARRYLIAFRAVRWANF